MSFKSLDNSRYIFLTLILDAFEKKELENNPQWTTNIATAHNYDDNKVDIQLAFGNEKESHIENYTLEWVIIDQAIEYKISIEDAVSQIRENN